MTTEDQRTTLREAIAIVNEHGLEAVNPSGIVKESRTFEQGQYSTEYVAELDVLGEEGLVIQCISQESMEKAKELRDQLLKRL